MTFQEVLQTKSFKMMALGFGIAVIGVLFAAVELTKIGQWTVWLGILVGFVGLAMHFRLLILLLLRKK